MTLEFTILLVAISGSIISKAITASPSAVFTLYDNTVNLTNVLLGEGRLAVTPIVFYGLTFNVPDNIPCGPGAYLLQSIDLGLSGGSATDVVLQLFRSNTSSNTPLTSISGGAVAASLERIDLPDHESPTYVHFDVNWGFNTATQGSLYTIVVGANPAISWAIPFNDASSNLSLTDITSGLAMVQSNDGGATFFTLGSSQFASARVRGSKQASYIVFCIALLN